jgi:D-lactate dehydrogenase (cytochrome)
MTRTELRDTALQALGDLAPEADLTSLGGDELLTEALDLDSFDFLRFVQALHDATGVDVPEVEYPLIATLDGAVECVVAVLRLGVPVARIELADAAQIDAINRHEEMDHEVAPTLFLEFHGAQNEVEEQAAEVQEVALEHGACQFAWATDESERRRLWHARHAAYDAARATRPGSQGLTTDVCVPLSRLAECLRDTQADIAELGLPAPIVGHVGDGNFHTAVLLDPSDPSEVARAEAFHERLVRRAIAMEGTCTGEHGVGYGKAAFLLEEHGADAVAMMRRLQHALEPADISTPGPLADAAAAAPPS